MASTREAERWLALEFLTVASVRTIHGFSDSKGLLGPQQFGAMLAAFAMLSVLVMYEPTAELAALLGALLVLATLLRPTVAGSTAGAEAAQSVGSFARNVGTSAPSLAKGAS